MLRESLKKRLGGCALGRMLLLGLIGIVLTGVAYASSSLPAVQIIGQSAVASTLKSGQGASVMDACGNIYSFGPDGNVNEIPVGGGAPSVAYASGDGGGDIWIDSTKSNIYIAGGWNSTNQTARIPVVNCALQGSKATAISVGDLGAISWWYKATSIAADLSGNIFIGTGGACCTSANELLEENSTFSTGSTLLTGLANPVVSIAVDASNNIYYVSGGQVFELPYTASSKSYASAAISFGATYNTATGVSIDSVGNLYVTDSGAKTIYEIPIESGVLTVADQFVLLPNTPAASALSAGNSGVFTFTDGQSGVYELNIGNVNFGYSAVGVTLNETLTAMFYAAETPKSISMSTVNSAYQNVGGSCAAGTSYAAGSSCTLKVAFTAMAPGASYSALTITDAAGASLAKANLTAVGNGSLITVDPGKVSKLSSGFKTAAGVAIDAAGDFFIADAGANAVYEIASDSSTAVSVGSGLSGPQGVAVDGSGNLFIADTGNNRIVEVPIVSGALSSAAQVVVLAATDTNGNAVTISGAALKAPAGVTVDGYDNLYIADTGNGRVISLPATGGWPVSGATVVMSSLSSPQATALDSNNDLFIANTGEGQIYELPLGGSPLLVAVGFGNPSGLAVDASNSLFVADSKEGNIVRIPALSGSLNASESIEAGLGITAPSGLAIDVYGNLYTSDSTAAAAYQINRSAAVQNFGSWALNTTGGPLSLQAENAGNATLTLSSPFYTATGNTADFTIGSSSSEACTAGQTIATGAYCDLAATFTPAVSGVLSETLTLDSNAATTAQITLNGTGVSPTASKITLAMTSPASGAPFFGEAITLTATAAGSGGTPTGNVELMVDGVLTATTSLSSGTATFALATGLPGGSHSLVAVYEGDTVFGGSDSAALAITVTKAATSNAMTLTIPYANPYSQLQGSAVTFTSTITPAGVGIPTGIVTFTSNGTTIGTASVTPVAGGIFQAAISISSLPLGANVIVANYSGDANYISSASPSATVNIVAQPGLVVTSGGSTATASAGSSSAVTFTTTSYGGWTGVVGFSCDASTLPANARCIFSPGQASVVPSTQTNTYSIPQVQFSLAIDQPPQTPTASGTIWWIALPAGVLLLLVRRRICAAAGNGVWSALVLVLAGGVITAGLVSATACSSSTNFVTPTGTSAVKVLVDLDPYKSGSTTSVQSCGLNSTTNQYDPTLSPCSQQAFTVNVSVQ
jgi:sugar lactone lactonase YvrE